MCLVCDCPPPVQPPNQKIAKCRTMLKILALGLLIIGVIGIMNKLVFEFLYDLLLIYMLWMSWTVFNWCMTLAFFLFSTIQTVQALIVFIGMLQYSQLFKQNTILISIYCILTFVYYPVAVYFSHYCYKNFKHHFQGNGQMFMMNQAQQQNAPQPQQGIANYQRMNDQQQAPRRNNNREQRQQNNYFGGQGVRIG